MDMEYKFGKMELNTKETGDSIKHVVKESFGMLMETFLKVNGLMTKLMDMEFTSIKMELDTKENGKMIFNTVKVKKYGQIIQCMKATITKVKNTEKDFIFGKMDPVMMEIGLKTELKAKVFTNGKMDVLILVPGKTIICMVKVCTHGLTVDVTKDNMKWIKSMGMEFINGLMVEFMKAIGIMVNNMVKENIFSKMELLRLASG